MNEKERIINNSIEPDYGASYLRFTMNNRMLN